MKNETTTRERILKAAFELISSKGYLGSSTREIALQAKVAEVTLFRHFTNKESLFAEVLRSFSAIPVLSELIPQLISLPYKEALETLTMRYLEQIVNNRSWIRVLGYEINHAPAEMRNVYAKFLKQLFGVLTVFFVDAHERGVIRPDLKPEHTARAFHSMIFGFCHIEGIIADTVGEDNQNIGMIGSFVNVFLRGTQADEVSQVES
jgi:AcrR family transcriptional regulator